MVLLKILEFFIYFYILKNITNAPIIAIMKPSIFSPKAPWFWSPNPNILRVIVRASYTITTPKITNNSAINFITCPKVVPPFA